MVKAWVGKCTQLGPSAQLDTVPVAVPGTKRHRYVAAYQLPSQISIIDGRSLHRVQLSIEKCIASLRGSVFFFSLVT